MLFRITVKAYIDRIFERIKIIQQIILEQIAQQYILDINLFLYLVEREQSLYHYFDKISSMENQILQTNQLQLYFSDSSFEKETNDVKIQHQTIINTSSHQKSDFILTPSQIQNVNSQIEELKDSVIGKNLFPKFSQLQTSIQILKKIAPEIFSDQMVDRIYIRAAERHLAVEKESKSNATQPNQEFQLILNNSLETIRDLKKNQINLLTTPIQCFDNNYSQLKQQYEQKLAENQPSYDLKVKLVARSFCNRNYGYLALQSYLLQIRSNLQIQKLQYERLLQKIIFQVFTHLEQFLVKEGYIKQMTNSKSELKIVYDTAINCRVLFPTDICEVFYNSIRGILQIQGYAAVNKDEAIRLYQFMRQNTSQILPQYNFPEIKSLYSKQNNRCQTTDLLNNFQGQNTHKIADKVCDEDQFLQEKRKRTKQLKFDLHKKWNSTYEQQLLELYKRSPNMANIRDRFKQLYPKQKAIFTSDAIRSKLLKILRISIKKLNSLILSHANNRLPTLMKLDDNRVKTIIYNHEGRDVRLLILQIYQKGFDQKLLCQTINSINLYISKSENFQNQKIFHKLTDCSTKNRSAPPFYHPKFKQKIRRGKYNRDYEPKTVVRGQRQKFYSQIDQRDYSVNGRSWE